MKLREILQQLETIYAGSIGAEFAHISESRERLWLQDQFQSGRLEKRFTADEKRNILWQLTAAEGLERYPSCREAVVLGRVASSNPHGSFGGRPGAVDDGRRHV